MSGNENYIYAMRYQRLSSLYDPIIRFEVDPFYFRHHLDRPFVFFQFRQRSICQNDGRRNQESSRAAAHAARAVVVPMGSHDHVPVRLDLYYRKTPA